MRVVIPKETDEKPAIIFDGRISRCREPIRVKSVTIRLIILLVLRIVDEKGIRRRKPTNHNPVHGMGLVVGPLDVAIAFVMEESERENRDPSPLVMANAVDKQKR